VIALCMGLALASTEADIPQAADLPAAVDSDEESAGTRHANLGHRIQADGLGAAVGLAEEWVAGGDGGILASRVTARGAIAGRYLLSASLPFATYRVPTGRTTGLGNLRLDGYRRIQRGDVVHLIGAQVHLPLGRSYTWTNDARSIWPGGGVSAVYQGRRVGEAFDLLFRGALGLYGTGGFAPYPDTYLQGSVAAGIDADLDEQFGITAETALTFWDTSPWEGSAWLRVDPRAVEGLRARMGVLLPFGTWMGLSPSDKPAGVREITATLDISLAL